MRSSYRSPAVAERPASRRQERRDVAAGAVEHRSEGGNRLRRDRTTLRIGQDRLAGRVLDVQQLELVEEMRLGGLVADFEPHLPARIGQHPQAVHVAGLEQRRDAVRESFGLEELVTRAVRVDGGTRAEDGDRNGRPERPQCRGAE